MGHAEPRRWAAGGAEIVELPAGVFRGGLGRWEGDPAGFGAAYARAAAAWVAEGALSHRIAVPAGSPVEGELLALGFGHEQVYAVAPAHLVRDRATERGHGDVVVRQAGEEDLPALDELVPIVARHQAESPVFAPRTPAFFAELGAGIRAMLADATILVGGTAEGRIDGYLILEREGADAEIVLAAVRPESRGRGVASALVRAAAERALADSATTLSADWRSANREAAALWTALGFEPVRRRWQRTIDPTPTPTEAELG